MNGKKVYPHQLFRIVDFELLHDYTLRLHFEDDLVREVDLQPILVGPLFGPLRDPMLFAQVQLDETFGALEWPNGADISPTVLHDWPDHVESIKARQQTAIAH